MGKIQEENVIDIELLKRMEPLLNLSALERLAGITRGKLSKKIKVGSKLKVSDAEKIEKCLEEHGFGEILQKKGE